MQLSGLFLFFSHEMTRQLVSSSSLHTHTHVYIYTHTHTLNARTHARTPLPQRGQICADLVCSGLINRTRVGLMSVCLSVCGCKRVCVCVSACARCVYVRE